MYNVINRYIRYVFLNSEVVSIIHCVRLKVRWSLILRKAVIFFSGLATKGGGELVKISIK